MPTSDPGDIARMPGSEAAEQPTLSRLARLGLPHGKLQLVRRALIYVPWRLFLRPQVAFNKSAAKAVSALEAKVAKLDRKADAIAISADAAASAVREQLYDTEGELRRTLSDIQIELARLEQRIGRS